MPDAFQRLCRAAILFSVLPGPAAAEPGWFIPGHPDQGSVASGPDRAAAVVPPTASRPPGTFDRAEFLDAFMPFYRISPSNIRQPEATVVGIEATMRPTYSATVPLFHQEIPLPPGNWTIVSVDGDTSSDDGPSSGGLLVARLAGHQVTGLILIRGSDPKTPGTLARLPPNRFCDTGGRYASRRLAGPVDGRDSCWFVAETTAPALFWALPDAPPELRVGLETMQRTGEKVPPRMVGVTYFRISGPRWIEVTTFFDPVRNGIAPSPGDKRLKPAEALADPAMRSLVDRMSAWTTRRLPLLDALGAVRTPPGRIVASNVAVPD